MKSKGLGLWVAVLVLMLINCSSIEGSDRDVYITTESSCRIYDLDDDEINIIFSSFPYFGLGDCRIKINDNRNSDRMCVKAKDLDLDCGIKLEVHAGIVTSFPDKTYTCSTSTRFNTEYCTYLDSMTIIVKQTSRVTTSSAKLKVYPKGSDFGFSDIAETAVIGVYVIVAIVVGGIILLIIIIVVAICCCCKGRRSSSGQVYRNQQPAAQPQPASSAYPQVQYSAVSPQAAGYQPPQQGYNPTSQGYNPPPQGYNPSPQGYNPPPQGYNPPPGQMASYPPQPVPQGYGAPPPAQGYQTAETQKMPSAPMLEKDPNAPPPYPGM